MDAPSEPDQTPAAPGRKLADGRQLPKLLFATSKDRLRNKIGPAADDVFQLLSDAGQSLLDISDHDKPWLEVGAASSGVDGVVLLGGYDVVRSQRLDVLTDVLRKAGSCLPDLDDYIVWSDDCFGDTDGDGLPEIPVSRIPDAGSADFLLDILCCPTGTAQSSRFGIRNSARPYADNVFNAITGNEAINISAPFAVGHTQKNHIDAAGIYMVLHGSKHDQSMFWGEDSSGTHLQAFSLGCIPDGLSGVVFSGACWGALCVEKPATDTPDGTQAVPLKTTQSIALRFLEAGATTYVGATGAHYSPISGAIHHKFWEGVMGGTPPAKALFDAKAYFAPHVYTWPNADEYGYMFKTWRQFTCLGFGW